MPKKADPARDLMSQLGDLSTVHVTSNRILVAQYIREKIGSIQLAEVTKREDQWQGKAALVLKLGPQAYVDDAHTTFPEEDKVKVGDWIMVRPSDGQMCKVNGVLCKLIEERNVLMKIDAPERIY